MGGATFLTMIVVRHGGDPAAAARRYSAAAAALSRVGALPVDVDLRGVWEVREPVTTRDVAHALHGVLGTEDEVRFYVPIRRGELATYRVAGGGL